MTEYDANEKKVQVKYLQGERLDLKELRGKWEQKSANVIGNMGQGRRDKDYELTQVILTNTYWSIFAAVHKPTTKSCTIKVYSKKFIGLQ